MKITEVSIKLENFWTVLDLEIWSNVHKWEFSSKQAEKYKNLHAQAKFHMQSKILHAFVHVKPLQIKQESEWEFLAQSLSFGKSRWA